MVLQVSGRGEFCIMEFGVVVTWQDVLGGGRPASCSSQLTFQVIFAFVA